MINFNKIADTTLKDNSKIGLKIAYVRWTAKTAGPSPFNNERTELFLLGCKKALEGNPCQGCFNSGTWDASKQKVIDDPIKTAEYINEMSPNKYITIGGGEPTDQIDGLIELCKELKEKYGFHIMVYTWRSITEELKLKPLTLYSDGDNKKFLNYDRGSGYKLIKLMKYIDMIVDGEFKLEEKLWDGSKEDGFLSSIGSGNQIVWNTQKGYGYAMRDIKSLNITKNNKLQYILKKKPKKYKLK